jgi:hypothetical protein
MRHGLAAPVAGDPVRMAEVEAVVAVINDQEGGTLDREQALIVAESQVTLKRVRSTRADLLGQLSSAEIVSANSCAQCLDQLMRLERYERRGLSRWKRAVRQDSFQNKQRIRQGSE